MKILFVTHKVDFVSDDIEKAIEYFKEKTPLDIEYDVLEAPDVRVMHTMFLQRGTDFWMGTYKTKEQLRTLIPENKYHAVVFLYDQTKSDFFGIKNFVITSWTFWKPLYTRTEYSEVIADATNNRTGWIWKSIVHELMHAFVKRANRAGRGVLDEMDSTIVKGKRIEYYHNEDPYYKDGNHERTLRNLEGHWDMVDYFPESWPYKYFTRREVEGLEPRLIQLMDEARDLAGIPFVITSGKRTKKHNEDIGGVADSSHLTGLAADIRVKSNSDRMGIVNACLDVGFNRIGIYKTHIHVDISKQKTQNVIWM